MFGRLVIVFCLISLAGTALGCPWCKTNVLQKPTVLAGTPDPGGKFFGREPEAQRTKHYYIAAEPVQWNFAPLLLDPVTQSPLPPAIGQHPVSPKLRYVRYTDETFSVRANSSDRLGILGPVMRGVVGDYLAVTFLNRTDRPLSMHPHGVQYDKDSEGAAYFPNPGLGAAIAPEARFTYVWKLDEKSGPLPSEPSSKAWLYHSHVLADQEINLGLIGFIVVTDPKRARPDGTPQDIDREMAALFMAFDESGPSEEDDEQAAAQANPKEFSQQQLINRLSESVQLMQRQEQAARHTINGLTFGNLKGLEMNYGEHVRWYLFALGSEKDLHSAHWHGERVIENGQRRTDVIELLPGSMKVADMVADNPGSWMFQCHVADHMMHGMYTTYVVHPEGTPAQSVALGDAFFSAQRVPESLRIQSARIEIDFAQGNSNGVTFKISGQFSPLRLPNFGKGPVEVRIGQRVVPMTMNTSGRGEGGDSPARARIALQVLRAGRDALGATLSFELVLSGEDWRQELQTLGFRSSLGTNDEVAVPLALAFDRTTLAGTVIVRYRVENSGKGVGNF